MKVVAGVPVRMGSSRFPGKVLCEVNNKPLLEYQIERLQTSNLINELVIATSTRSENDPIQRLCDQLGVRCFRGSEDDVLGRLTGAYAEAEAEIAVLIFGDAPLIDPEIPDSMINDFLNLYSELDFLGNDLKTTYPPGMEVEVMRMSALIDAEKRATDKHFREHGTLYIRLNPDLYRLKNIEAPQIHYRPELEIELDTEEDFQVIEKIILHFDGKNDFSLSEIIDFLDSKPEIASLNQHLPRRWKAHRQD